MGKVRGNGEGTIHERKQDGLWLASWYDPDGKRRVAYGKKRSVAVAKRDSDKAKDAEDRENASKKRTETDNITLGQYLLQWIAGPARSPIRKPHPLKPRSLADYQRIIELFVLSQVGDDIRDVPLVELGRRDIKAFLDKVATLKSVSRAHAVHAVLSSAIAEAIDDGLIDLNPAARLAPAVKNAPVFPFTPEELPQLMATSSQHSLGTLVLVALATGMRKGELQALRWSAIDFERGRINVQGTMHWLPGGVFDVAETKTGHERVVAVPGQALDGLRLLYERQVAEREAVGTLWEDNGFVFTDYQGRPLHGNHITRAWHVILREAKLPARKFHTLRHSFATLSYANGTQLRTISEQLGHASLAVTDRIYTHLLDSTKTEAADKMEGVLALAATG